MPDKQVQQYKAADNQKDKPACFAQPKKVFQGYNTECEYGPKGKKQQAAFYQQLGVVLSAESLQFVQDVVKMIQFLVYLLPRYPLPQKVTSKIC